MKVFFYGLFMDEVLLAEKGIRPAGSDVGFLEGYALRIGARATLFRKPGGRAWGVVIEISEEEASSLYAEESVADYVPETVSVELQDGSRIEASCYNLSVDKISGTNRDYAQALLKVATRLGFPGTYLDAIRNA